MTNSVRNLSSMATAGLLAELSTQYQRISDQHVAVESIGGINATKKIQAGEPYDVIVLADNAIQMLTQENFVRAGSQVALARSGVAIAVAEGASVPDISSEEALRDAVVAARTIGYSTGPSGVAIADLIERWGLTSALKDRLVQAEPGEPVGALIAQGKVELGFQQLSELMHLPQIKVLGPMPPGIEIETVFSAGICSSSPQPELASAWLNYLCSPEVAQTKERQGMMSV